MENLGPIEESNQFNRTQKEQAGIEETIAMIYMQIHMKENALPENSKGNIMKAKSTLGKEKTATYLTNFLKNHTLTQGFENQKTWVMFFLLYGLELIGQDGKKFDDFEDYDQLEMCHYLGKFWNKDGKSSTNYYFKTQRVVLSHSDS